MKRRDILLSTSAQLASTLRAQTVPGRILVGNALDEFARVVQAEIVRWARIVKLSGAKPV